MKVLHVCAFFLPAIEWGGPVRSVSALVRAQLADGIHVEVITTNGRGADGLLRAQPGTKVVDGMEVHYHASIGPRRYFFSPTMVSGMFRLIRKVHVVHIHGLWTFPSTMACWAARLSGVPYVISPKGTLSRWGLTQKRLKKVAYLWAIENGNLRGAALIHASTNRERTELPAWLGSCPKAVVPNVVEFEDLLDLNQAKAVADRLRLLLVGRIHVSKGIDIQLEAMRLLLSQGVSVSLTIAGPREGSYWREIEEEVRQLGLEDVVLFSGKLSWEDLKREYKEADVVVVPSRYESFGMAVAEAMAAARPVVVSDEVGTAEDVRHCGAGFVVPLIPQAFAESIAVLAKSQELRRSMGENGRSFVLENFSGRAIAAQWHQLYDTIVS